VQSKDRHYADPEAAIVALLAVNRGTIEVAIDLSALHPEKAKRLVEGNDGAAAGRTRLCDAALHGDFGS
jgi:hypothetical protein